MWAEPKLVSRSPKSGCVAAQSPDALDVLGGNLFAADRAPRTSDEMNRALA